MHPALSDLYRTYGAIIFSRCRRLLMDDALAEQATQEIFVTVMRLRGSDAAILGLIYRVTTEHCRTLADAPANPTFLSAAH